MSRHFDAVVLGGGPAGEVAVSRLAEQRLGTALVESLGARLLPYPWRVIGGDLGPFLESRPDRVPLELGELGNQEEPSSIHEPREAQS